VLPFTGGCYVMTRSLLRSRTVSLSAVLTTLVGLAWAPAVRSHGLDANRIQVVLHEGVAEVVATPPSDYLPAYDANHDGRLTVAEVSAHREEVVRALVAALDVTDGEGRRGTLDRADVSVPRSDDADEALGRDYLRATVVLRWPTPPAWLRVRCDFVTQHPVTVFASRAESVSTPGVLTLVGAGEYESLTSREATATMLRGAPAATPAAAPVALPPPPAASTSAPAPSPVRTVALSLVAVLALGALAWQARKAS
jgi:hypothetical protein